MFTIKNARFSDGSINDLRIEDGIIKWVRQKSRVDSLPGSYPGLDSLESFADVPHPGVIDSAGSWLSPAFIDVHVHSRDPGDTHKETWESLRDCAYKGGVVGVCDMPNTRPPTLDAATLRAKMVNAEESGLSYRLYLGVTAANISGLDDLLSDPSLPICGLKVYYGASTGGYTYSDLEALHEALRFNSEVLICFHSEDQCSLDFSDKIFFDPELDYTVNKNYAVHSKIRSPDAALHSTNRILKWAKETKHRIHIAHVSTAAEFELIHAARSQNVRVTAEVTPHHLLLSTLDYDRLGPFAKMNPPLRDPEELESLRKWFSAGYVECFATDHAPHTREEKLIGRYQDCPSGVPSLEFYAPLLFKAARLWGLSDDKAEKMGAETPARLFGFERQGQLRPGFKADLVWLSERSYDTTKEALCTKAGWSPYEGFEFPVHVESTWHNGKRVYQYRGA